jgi:hypothetical protein
MTLAADIEAALAPPPGGGAATPSGESGPRRRCIASREVRSRAELVRFVVGPSGVVVPDLEGRLPGRGLWLRADRDIVTRAARKNLFAKAAGAAVTVPDGLVEQVERLLARRCLELLGIACRAGQAVAGFEKVHGWLAADRVGLLLAASDGGADARRKLAGVTRREVPLTTAFSGAELAGALGRGAAVAHVAVASGRVAERLAQEAKRLAGLRGTGLQGAGAGGMPQAADGDFGGGGGADGPRQH